MDKNGGEIGGIVVQSVTATSVVSLGYGQDRGVTAIPLMMARTVVMAVLIVMLIVRVRAFATEKGYNLTGPFRAAFMNPHTDI